MSNENVFEITHCSDGEEQIVQGNSPADGIMQAVRSELASSRSQIIEEVHSKTLPSIEAAVKRAFAAYSSQGESSKKRVRRTPQFRSKGNQKRYDDTEEVLEKLESAETAIGVNNIVAAKEAIKAGKELLLKQQKYVKMVDREELGWEVVRHYVSDDLASDSEDEKAINRARREALASLKKKKLDSAGKSTSSDLPTFRSSSSSYRSKTPTRSSHSPADSHTTICYACGRTGHMQYSCPSRYSRRK